MERVKRIVLLVLVVGLSLVFGYAGIIKFLHPDIFMSDVLSYRILPYSLALGVAYFLPALEAVCAGALWVSRLRRAASLILLGMMVVFTIALLVAWGRGLDISCGCFGASEVAANYPLLVLRDLVLIAACAGVFLIGTKKDAGLKSPAP